jgi:hypothetical protein
MDRATVDGTCRWSRIWFVPWLVMLIGVVAIVVFFGEPTPP